MDQRSNAASANSMGYAHPMRRQVDSRMQNVRRTLIESDLLVAEELVARPELPPQGNTERRTLAITFAGAFEFQVGRSVSWVDPSRLLFAEAGQSFIDHHVVPGTGHSSLLLRPGHEVLEELWGNRADAQFANRVGACSTRVQMLVQYLRRAAEPLAAQELGVAILEESIAEKRRVTIVDPHCVRRAKAALHDSVEGRSSLMQIASDLGVTPIHLTQTFKRSEGIPLYRYQTLLRLGRALDRLPEKDDITDLALELGFSSHSHFTAAFRSEFGLTPSHYRSQTRSTRALVA
jgi:AraC family transcriptional regulator